MKLTCSIDLKSFRSHASIIPIFIVILFLFFLLFSFVLITGSLFVIILLFKVWQFGILQYVQDAPAFNPSLILQVLHKHAIEQVLAPLLEHVVGEAEAFCLKTPACQLLEKVSDHVRPRIVILVQDYVLELIKFDLTRFVVIDELEQEIDSFGRVDETKTDEWAVKLIRRYRAIPVPIQRIKELSQSDNLAAHIKKQQR